MNIADFISKEEVQRVCRELGIRDWTKLTDTNVQIEEARIIQSTVGSEALQIPAAWFQQGLEVELEHGLQFPDANVTNNHPILTGKIVLAHLKEMLDYYLRLNVAELEGDLLKASKKGDAEKLARIYTKLVAARAELGEWEKSEAAT
jgi:restriction endonuclease Mrr